MMHHFKLKKQSVHFGLLASGILSPYILAPRILVSAILAPCLLVVVQISFSAESLELPNIEVRATRPYENNLQSLSTSDTAKLLEDEPGLSLYGAGGVSSLPAIHGMADDRLRIKVDGMDLISACANHMNPALSYIDPANVSSIKVLAGITPVSLGGDSIGGTIIVNSAAPTFAQAGQGILLTGQATTFYRSNNAARGANLSATVAGESLSVRYTGSTVSANNIRAADNFKPAGLAATDRGWLAGDEVGSSAYRADNHALAFGLRHENHLFDLKLGVQNIPYQGFPNQRMDMTLNKSQHINLSYTGQYDWGVLESRIYHENTRHSMDFGEDKLFTYPNNANGMPMDTRGKNTGALLKINIPLNPRDTLRVGAEYQRYRLDDWWGVSGTGGMSPLPFVNINNGQRDRYDVFAEWEAKWSQQWLSQLGLRSSTVNMDAGNVQGYKSTGTIYPAEAAQFNATNRSKTDHNWDLTALAKFTPDSQQTYEAGYAIKTRSPNLYERYTWSNQSSMVMNMNNWVGDGNGYVGDINLKPEVAHTLSMTGNWHDAAQQKWRLKVTPYISRVENYIDAVACPTCVNTRTDGFVNLSLANQTARLYGADVSANMVLLSSSAYGSFDAKALVNYVKGTNLTTHDDLYNIMPLNLKVAVEQRLGQWRNTIEAKFVSAKTDVQAVRQELPTAGYGLLNFYSSYEWKQARLDIGVENMLNKYYIHPLGGAYLGQGATMMSSSMMGITPPQYGTLVPSMGRSINTSVTFKF
jgi:iron complex outermembrane receptor protein